MSDSNSPVLPPLKRLPAELEIGQRIMLEAIDLACDFINIDMKTIRDSISLVLKDRRTSNISEIERLTIFKAAWSIIDRVDAVRLIVHNQRERVQLGESEPRKELFKRVRAMRNGMDHLGTNEKKFRKDRTSYPIFGAISFNWYDDKDFVIADDNKSAVIYGLKTTIFSASAMHYDPNLPLNNITDNYFYETFGNIRLFAFENDISISEAVGICNFIRASANHSLEELYLKLQSARTSETINSDCALTPTAGTMTLTLGHKFSEPQIIYPSTINPCAES